MVYLNTWCVLSVLPLLLAHGWFYRVRSALDLSVRSCVTLAVRVVSSCFLRISAQFAIIFKSCGPAACRLPVLPSSRNSYIHR